VERGRLRTANPIAEGCVASGLTCGNLLHVNRGTSRGATPSLIAAVAAAVVALAIYAGSRGLRYFDAALIGYATAVVVLILGVTYRYVVWVSSPPARRYLRWGWQAFFSWRNFRRLPTAVPRSGAQQAVGASSPATSRCWPGVGGWGVATSCWWRATGKAVAGVG
jgi:hypothetical protein